MLLNFIQIFPVGGGRRILLHVIALNCYLAALKVSFHCEGLVIYLEITYKQSVMHFNCTVSTELRNYALKS